METKSDRVDGLFAYLAVSGLINLGTWVLLLFPNFLQPQGWSAQKIGWAVGAYFSINLVTWVLAGQIAERVGNIRTALWGVWLGVAAGVLYLFSLWWTELIFPARILHGGGAGLVHSGALIQLTYSVPLHRKGQVMGYFGLPGFVMIGIGPLLSEWLVYYWGYQGSFLVVLGSFLLTGWLLLRLPRVLVTPSRPRVSFLVTFKASYVRLEAILAFSIFFGLCFSAWNGFLAPAVVALGAGAVSSFSLGYAMGAVISRLGFSGSLRNHTRRLAAISVLLPYGIGLVLIPLASTDWHLLILGIVCGAGHGIYYPSLSSLAAERFHPLYPGQGMSLYIAASAFGLFVGPPIWGGLADRFGFPPIFVAAGLLLVLSTVIFLASESRTRKESPLQG